MIQAPWDDRLWSLLSTEPDKITSQVIQENLRKRKCFRTGPDVSGPDKVLRPPSGEWRGEYQDMRTNERYEVKYRITFLEDGRVQGSAISTDDQQALQDFKINGIHSLRTGIVAWSQFPSQPRPNTQASEFYGDAFMCPSGPARITGTFVTPDGRYCVVNLVDPTAPKAKEVDRAQVAVTFNLPKMSDDLPLRRSSETSPDHLPTLLTGCRTPIKAHIANNLKEGRPAFFPKM
eukprot:gnl/MRDRNA2_/MRDRNA2_91366_c0_seq1.p1 gnl/MRDRNA2_/MRDRNA2_91366_c0~~gnl/MRDRNA2_/MRDRNA2_91366_c0_seq1.p1  ORF type:complete len:233 (+),score=39.22 gnl/MRDRNA2_/MRDRNA2_91366_c0_seq1:82-780(+)